MTNKQPLVVTIFEYRKERQQTPGRVLDKQVTGAKIGLMIQPRMVCQVGI